MLFWEEFLSNVFVWLKTFSLFCVSVISVKLQINNKTELFHYLSKELKNERRELPEGELIRIGSFLLTFICSHLGRLFRGKLLLTASSLRVTAVDLRPPSHPPTSSGVFFLPPVRAGVWKLRLLPVARVGRGRTKARLKAAQMSSHSCEPLSLIGGKTHRKRRKTGVEVAVWTMCPSVDDSVFAANRRRFVAEKAHWSQMMLWPDKQQFGQKVAPWFAVCAWNSQTFYPITHLWILIHTIKAAYSRIHPKSQNQAFTSYLLSFYVQMLNSCINIQTLDCKSTFFVWFIHERKLIFFLFQAP